jgi:dihydroorotase
METLNSSGALAHVQCADPRHPKFGQQGFLYWEHGICLGFFTEPQPAFAHVPHWNAKGYQVAPGFFDMGLALAPPQTPFSSSLSPDLQALVDGGWTGGVVLPLPPFRTDLPLFHQGWQKALDATGLKLMLAGSVTSEEHALAPIYEIASWGTKVFSHGTATLADSLLLMHVLDLIKETGGLYMHLPGEPSLHPQGQVHPSPLGMSMGLAGIPEEAESIGMWRDVQMAKKTGQPLHWWQISSGAHLNLLDEAKAYGITAGVSAAHLWWNDQSVEGYAVHRKLMPPLRTEKDRLALLKAVEEDKFACITSGHIGWNPTQKQAPFTSSPFGAHALRSSALAVLDLVQTGALSLKHAIQALAYGPRDLLKMKHPQFLEGAPADYTLFSTKHTTHVPPYEGYMASEANPWAGTTLHAKIAGVWVDGVFKGHDLDLQG